MSFESQLRNFLEGFEKLIVLGVGNELKCDDGVGPYIIKKLKEGIVEDKDRLLFIDAQTVPENFTGKIRKETPTHLIIVDACLMGGEAGDMKVVDENDFAISFNPFTFLLYKKSFSNEEIELYSAFLANILQDKRIQVLGKEHRSKYIQFNIELMNDLKKFKNFYIFLLFLKI
jgi:hydrogenase maturation protease